LRANHRPAKNQDGSRDRDDRDGTSQYAVKPCRLVTQKPKFTRHDQRRAKQRHRQGPAQTESANAQDDIGRSHELEARRAAIEKTKQGSNQRKSDQADFPPSSGIDVELLGQERRVVFAYGVAIT